MKMLTNLWKPTEGSIELFGKKLTPTSYEVLKRMGSIIEFPTFYDHLDGRENLKLHCEYMGYYNPGSIENALEILNLADAGKKPVRSYSLGMKQRLAIALAVMHDPEILILDEPINGLDPIGIAEIRTFIEDLSKNRGKTILISSHILSEIAVLADDIGIIDKGVLIEEGSMKELEEKNGKYVHFKVSDNAQAARILSVYYKESNFKVSGNQDINVYNLSISIPDIVRSFVQEGVDVMDAHLCEDTLEDYFKKVTGGEGIA
jgi:ABC-type multidrug transport system ATPase subunit